MPALEDDVFAVYHGGGAKIAVAVNEVTNLCGSALAEFDVPLAEAGGHLERGQMGPGSWNSG